MKFVSSAFVSITFLASLANASSSYEIRTNEEMTAVLQAAIQKADYKVAVESITHLPNGDYQVSFSSNCSETYSAIRGSAEAEGLQGVKVAASTCK